MSAFASIRRLLAGGAVSALVLALVIGLGVTFGVYGSGGLIAPIGTVLGCWIVLSALVDPIVRLRRGLSLPAAVIGMTVAHIGLGIITIGITTTETARVEQDVALKMGQSVTLGHYQFRFDGTAAVQGPNYDATQARIVVSRDGREFTTLLPEKRNYIVQEQAIAEAALSVGAKRDLLVTLGEDLGAGAWSLRVQVRPLMMWVWLGAALMAIGGLVSACDRRYRRLAMAAAGATDVPAPAVTPRGDELPA